METDKKLTKMKTFALTIAALLFAATTAIFTANRPVTMSSTTSSGLNPGSKAVDNNFATLCHTAGTEVPWVNIQLAESAIVRSVAVIVSFHCCYTRIGIASITVGTNPDPHLNAVCKANIDRDGIFVCDTPLTGTYVGLTRTAIGGSDNNAWHFAEIRAYPWVQFDELTSTLSADVMPNASLV